MQLLDINLNDIDVDYSKEYVNGVKKSNTLADLKEHCEKFKCLAPLAYTKVQHFSATDFEEFKRFVAAKDFVDKNLLDKYAEVLLPKLLLKVGDIMLKFIVPWSVAFIQLGRAGGICIHDNMAYDPGTYAYISFTNYFSQSDEPCLQRRHNSK